MRMEGARSVSAKAKDFSVEVSQNSAGKARGRLRFVGGAQAVEVRLEEAGLLQAHGKWASFTGRARVMPEAEERTIRVIVDGGNPMGTGAKIVIEVEGGKRFESTMDAGSYRVGSR